MSETITPSRIKAIAWAGAALFMVAVAVVSAALVWNARTVALDDNEAQATRFVAGAEAALNRSLLSVDVLLASMDELLGLSGAMRDWIDPAQASQRLRSSARQNLMVRYVALLDANNTEAIGTGGTVKVQVAGSDVTGMSVTIANSAAVGKKYQAGPTTAQASYTQVKKGQTVSVVNASFATSGAVAGYVEIQEADLDA